MQTPTSKQGEFRFSLAGMFSKTAPDLLRDGQYRSLSNVCSNQEGSLSSRTGTKLIGSLGSTTPAVYQIRKLRVYDGENPLVPSLNPRYLGAETETSDTFDIYRTTNYTSASLVASGVDSSESPHWEMTDYTAGETGSPWAYFACSNAMLKDRGLSPYSTLVPWGIQPAHGVPMAAVVTGDIATVDPPITEGTPVTIFLSGTQGSGVADADVITFTGITGTPWLVPAVCPTTPDGLYYAKVIGYSNSAADPYYAEYGQGGAFGLYDSNGQGVPVQSGGSWYSGVSVSGIALSGNLNGGAVSSPNNTNPYDWVTTLVEVDTQDEGNPGQSMSANSVTTGVVSGITYTGVPVAVNGGQALVLIWGFGPYPNTRFPTINVYRRGGTLSDMVYRLVANVPNQGYGNYTTFTDNTADADLVYAQQITVDNDPPVPSTVPSPITGTINATVTPGVLPSGTPYQTAALTMTNGSMSIVTPGSTVHVLDSATPEDVVAVSVTSSGFTAYFQFPHAIGTPIEVDTIMGQPCNLTMTFGDCLLVAGDRNNPHLLYRGKSGSPQAFPVGEDAAGGITSMGVGTPSNGIVNMCEFRGQVCCMNVSSLFEVAVSLWISGYAAQASEVAKKGLVGQSAWCKTSEPELWFLSTDGVYSWDGGSLRKRTEQIDPIFHGQEYNGMAPLDYSLSSRLAAARMEYRRGVVRLVYYDVNGNVATLACEPRYGDRWYPLNENQPAGGGSVHPIQTIYREPDTESLIVSVQNSTLGATFGIADAVFLSSGVNYTSDWWSTNGEDGTAIAWDVRLPWFDMGTPAMAKLFEEVWIDLDPQLYTGQSSITVELLLNYSDTAVDTFNIAIPSGSSYAGRTLVSLLPNMALVSGSTYQSFGREARAVSFHLYGSAMPVQVTLDRLLFQYQETGLLSAGSATDWLNLGNQHDVRVYQMVVTFDTAGTNRQIVLETRGGRDCLTAGTPQVFTLVSPTDLGSGRARKSFPVADPTIAKLFRVRPYTSATEVSSVPQSSADLFRIFDVSFPEHEIYPADVIGATPWEDGGYEYDKYANQLDLEVNTNGSVVTFQVQADGSTVFTGTATATESNRRVNVALPTGLRGKKWRVFVDQTQAAIASSSGMWQLFSHSFKFQKADLGEVVHTQDWDDLGYRYDKRLYTVNIRWDNSAYGDAAVTLQLDILSGAGGGTVQSAVATFSLGTTGRSEKTFPLPDGLIAKAVRLYPQGSTLPAGFKVWPPEFQKEQYPPDIVAFTPWEDGGYEYDKYANQLDLEVNTNNVSVTFQVQADGSTVFTGTAQQTESNRRVNVTLPTGLVGKKWRIFVDQTQAALTSGGGMWQLFSHSFKFQKADLGEVVHTQDWDDLGYRYDKRLYTVNIRWDNSAAGDAAVTLQLDILSGVGGGTVQSSVATFSLGTTGRSEKTFALPDGLIAKAVRLYPQGSTLPAGFKIWPPEFQKEQYPPDIVSFTPWEDGGYEYDKYANQLDLEVNTNNVAVTFHVQVDGSTVFTGTAQQTEPNRRVNVTLPTGLIGKKWRIFVDPTQAPIASGGGMWQLFSHSFKFQKADQGEVVHTQDWDDLGYRYDKRLYTVNIRWDNSAYGDAAVTLQLDLLSGVGGGTVQSAVATFSLGTTGRSEKTFPLPDGLIAKAVRLYPQGSTLPAGFKIWPPEFQKEQYPPDIVAFTPWEDGGYEYDKYANQIDLEVNTNNVAVTFQVQADGSTVFTGTAQQTEPNRRVNITLPTGLKGKKWRIFTDPTQAALTSGGGMWQLFSHSFKFEPADKGQVGHTFDWDDLGSPADKLLLNVTFEYDTTTGGSLTLQMDTLSGIGGTTLTSNVGTFTLGSGRGKTNFPIPSDTIVKMVRVYPSSSPSTGYKQWKYHFEQVNYPYDFVRVTPWKDASSPVDKEPSWLWIDSDTSGVAASVQLQNENGTVMTVSHTGTSSNRKKNYAIPVDTHAKMWRVLSQEGTGGRFQLWGWGFERWQPFEQSSPINPPEIILATPWNDFSYPFEKLARNLIITINTGGVACSVALQTSEAGTVFTTSVTSTNTTRPQAPIPCTANLLGKMWRLVFTPGTGGLSQLWNWSLDCVREPAAVKSWDSYEQTLGSKFFKFIAQGWWMYTCASSVTLTILSDTGTSSVTLPAHSTRATERFPLPSVWGSGLNKSKGYRVQLSSASPMKFYPAGSGLEFMVFGGDRHAAYQQSTFSEIMGIAAGEG